MSWIVAELPEDEDLLVQIHSNFQNAMDDFMDRYNDLKSRENETISDFEFDKSIGGYFKASRTEVWVTEAVEAKAAV